MHTFFAIIVFFIILALLVLVHEFGHFIVAKKSGMQVEEFGFGFPPRLFSVRKGETLYSFNLIPLGGFVKIVGENNDQTSNPRSFANKSFWQRFSTLVAGVVMNFILAWVLFAVGFGIGLPTVIGPGDKLPAHATLKSESISVLQVAPNSPAQKAGIREGDQIVAVNNIETGDVNQIVQLINQNQGKSVQMHLKRGNENLNVTVQPRKNPPPDQGAIGIALANVGRMSFPWYLTPVMGLKAAWEVIAGTAIALYHLIFQGQGLTSVGGPVKIASMTGEVTQLGIAYILQFAAFLSVNLGILNIIPFPALDGGRVLFLIIEKIRGKRNNEKIEGLANTIGFALLMALVLLISLRDIRGLFH